MPPEIVQEYFEEAPERGWRAKTEMARRICFSCIARDECLEISLEEMPDTGVYAGMTSWEREEYLSGGDAA
jgi:hypothetical protein